MAIAGERSINIGFTGDGGTLNYKFSAAKNEDSPAVSEIKALTTGNNTITPPTGGTTAKSVLIKPEDGNTQAILLKGVAGDTGISIHKTDPTQIGLNSPTDPFVLNVAGNVNVRFVWT